MEMTAGRGTRDDNDNYDQARRGEGKGKRGQQEGYHNDHMMTMTTAPLTAAMSNCSWGGNGE